MDARPMTREEAARIRLSAHALDAMARRGVEVEDLVDALLRPEVVEPNDGRVRFVRDGMAYVVAPGPVLVTVLLRERRQWSDGDALER
jgi:hypothetical protein